MHPHLRRLVREHVPPDEPVPPGWAALLEAVDRAWSGGAGPGAGEATFRALAETIAAAVFVYQGDRFRYVNAAASALVGYAPEELLGMNFWDVVHPDDRAMVRERGMARQRGDPVVPRYEFRVVTRGGEERWVDFTAGTVEYEGAPAALGTAFDVTERRRAEERHAHGAFHDALTGLPNRALFLDRLGQAAERVRRRGDAALAVLFLDLDRFKLVNDSLGHDTGDELLRAIAGRLSEALRPGDTAARFGGDEFTVLLENVGDAVAAAHVAQRLLESLSRPFQLRRHEVYTSASVGIALHTGGPATPEELVRNAGTALGRAKTRGRARHETFDRAMHAEALDRLRMETELRHAASRGELRLAYQPVVSLVEGGGVVGFEALLRWDHPARGRVLPERFVPVAEEAGLIVPIGEWVLEEACRQLRRWRKRFPDRRITMGVNLSARQLARAELVDRVRAVLRETGAEPSSLVLEVTESVLIDHTDPTAAMLARLREVGVGLCMDDFGTGYSSLGYLHRFPLDTLKIDRSFVTRLGREADAAAIVRTIAALAHNLGLAAVAEGVETAEQLAELRALRCELAQGFFFAPPLDPAEAERLLEEDPRW